MTTRQLQKVLKINCCVRTASGELAQLIDVGAKFSKVRYIAAGQIADRPNEQLMPLGSGLGKGVKFNV